MTDTPPNFGQLRSLLNQTATPENFRRVMAMFQKALEDNQEVVLEQWLPYIDHYAERYHESYPPKLYIDGFTWDWEIYDPLLPKDDEGEDLHDDITIILPEVQLRHTQTLPIPTLGSEQIEWIKTLDLPNFKQLAQSYADQQNEYLTAALHGKNAARLELLNAEKVDIDHFLDTLSKVSAPLSNLHTLNIQYSNITAEHLKVLGNQAKQLPALRRIDFRGNDFGDDGFQALFESQLWPQLTHLGLNSVGISYESFDHMLGLPKARPLLYMALNNNDEMTFNSIEKMATSDVVLDLTFLDISNIFIDEQIIDLLVKVPFRQLDRLHISQMPIGTDRMDRLGQWPSLKTVRHLSLYDSEQNSVTIGALMKNPNIGNLRFLDIDENPISKTMLIKIAKSKYLTNLEALEIGYLEEVDIGDVNAILQSKRLPKLKYVVLENDEDHDDLEDSPFTYSLNRADYAYFGDF